MCYDLTYEAISKVLAMENKRFFVYILANENNTTLYTGVTSNLAKRLYEHKSAAADGFSKKYNTKKFVYYEIFEDAQNAIKREKQIKAGSRTKKADLINSMNPQWRDLSDTIY